MNKLYYSLPFVLLLSAFYALRDDVNTYISTMWVGELLSYVSKACTNSSLFNILLALTLCCFFLIIGKKYIIVKGVYLGVAVSSLQYHIFIPTIIGCLPKLTSLILVMIRC